MAVKWLTTLLSVYLLGLSLWPCADEVLSPAGEERGTVLTALNASTPDASHPDHDQCTPFCTCACCAVTITVVPQLTYTLTASVDLDRVAAARFAYEPLPWADPLTTIWQPPKRRA